MHFSAMGQQKVGNYLECGNYHNWKYKIAKKSYKSRRVTYTAFSPAWHTHVTRISYTFFGHNLSDSILIWQYFVPLRCDNYWAVSPFSYTQEGWTVTLAATLVLCQLSPTLP